LFYIDTQDWLEKGSPHPNTDEILTHPTVKCRGEIYKIGDKIALNGEVEDYLCEITDFWEVKKTLEYSLNDGNPPETLLPGKYFLSKWFYKLDELAKHLQMKDKKSVSVKSNREVFATSHQEARPNPVDSLKRRVEINFIDDVDNLSKYINDSEDHYFYTQYFDNKTKKVHPKTKEFY